MPCSRKSLEARKSRRERTPFPSMRGRAPSPMSCVQAARWDVSQLSTMNSQLAVPFLPARKPQSAGKDPPLSCLPNQDPITSPALWLGSSSFIQTSEVFSRDGSITGTISLPSQLKPRILRSQGTTSRTNSPASLKCSARLFSYLPSTMTEDLPEKLASPILGIIDLGKSNCMWKVNCETESSTVNASFPSGRALSGLLLP